MDGMMEWSSIARLQPQIADACFSALNEARVYALLSPLLDA